jgi:hypothetical protein
VETAVISTVGEGAECTGQWPVRPQRDEAPKVTTSCLEIKRNDLPSKVAEQLLIQSEAATAAIDTQHPGVTRSEGASRRVEELTVPIADRRWVSHDPRRPRGIRFAIVMGALMLASLMALGLGWFGGSWYRYFLDRPDGLTGQTAIDAVVERIIEVESNGDPNAKNSRSSATGLSQFVNETWLDLVRAYRPDLIRGRSDSEALELRREAKLAREITTRFVERNAAMLRKRGLPVTAGTMYLAHFAGVAGAVAILSAPGNADAALVMAGADASGRTKREQLIKANPFLEHFTVADLRTWADRKMRSAGPSRIELRAAGAR